MPNWKITFELDPIGLFFFSVIGHFRNVGGPSGLLTISHADILQFRIGPYSKKNTIKPYYYVYRKLHTQKIRKQI